LSVGAIALDAFFSPVTLPDVNWQKEKYNIRGKDAVKVASDIEKSFRILL
jgi:hypothetical protein